jgi:ABC-type transport system substrate-binding protein
MLLFNVAGGPFGRLGARRAVSQALNLKAITANATGVAGGVVAADRGMLHPQSRWAGAGVVHRYQPAQARLGFVEQGIGAFRVAAPRNDPVRLEVGKRVVRALTNVGARASLLELSPAALDSALGRRGTRATFDVAIVGIPALASFDPAYLRAIFGDPRTAPLNDGGYRSPAFDALATRAASAVSVRVRRALVNEQLRLLARELPAVPLLFGGGTFAYRPAAYDRWVSIKGSGILDKRSLLRGAAPSASPATARPTDPLDPAPDEGFSLVPLIVGLAVLLLAGCAWWLRRGRS